jgi:hypothetical protein
MEWVAYALGAEELALQIPETLLEDFEGESAAVIARVEGQRAPRD